MTKQKLWSVTRIKNPPFPDQPAVRVSEWAAGGNLHFFRWINGKQQSRMVEGPDGQPLRRVDLGARPRSR